MSLLNRSEARALTALGRLERALQARAAHRPPEAGEAEQERLRRECEALRQEIAGLRARQERLVAVVDEVEGRLEGAIDQLDELAEE